jgi:hypothetical protein
MSTNRKKKKEEEKRQREKWKKRTKVGRSENNSLAHIPAPSLALTLPPGVRFAPPLPGLPKMSELILELVDPYAELCDSDTEAIHKLVVLGVIAWNAAVSDPERGRSLVQAMLATLPQEDRPTAASVVGNLIRRKIELYPDDRRVVYDYKVIDTPDGFRVQVASWMQESDLTR